MITDFDDFCLWMYVVIDELWHHVARIFPRPGPAAACSDSELLTMALVGECRGLDQETELVSAWRERPDLFPVVPERSRFNRRRRNLMHALNLIRQCVLQLLDLAQDRQCAIDSLPIPVVQFHLAPNASREWAAHGATFGKVVSKKQTIFGYKLHLLVTLNGVMLDFTLAPAHATDLMVGAELLHDHTDLVVLGDKGYISAEVAAQLAAHNRVQLLTIPRRNQTQQLPVEVAALLNGRRQIIETVHGQLTEQFHIATNHAHSFWGLCTRLYTKLTAHTLLVYLNRLVGSEQALHIKHLAFPI